MDYSVVKSSSHSRLASKLSVLESFFPYAAHVLYQYMEGAMSSVENNLVTMITLWSNDQVIRESGNSKCNAFARLERFYGTGVVEWRSLYARWLTMIFM